MAAPRDPNLVRRQLLAHFDNPPRLTFAQPGFVRLDYRLPGLDRSEQDRQAYVSNRPEPQRNAIGQLQDIVRKSIERLDYTDTPLSDWNAYVRFSLDRVEHKRGGIVLRPGKSRKKRAYINDTREDAHAWFRDELLPIVRRDRDAHVYILGEPGAGKSTLLKYLINVNSGHLQDTATILSRFEFQKFCARWYSGNFSRLRTDLSGYISFLLLRDLIWFLGYGIDSESGQRIRRWPLPALQRIVKKAFDKHGLESFTKQINLAARQLDHALEDHKIDFRRLKQIQPWVMTVLVDELREGQSIALIIDGLDCVAIEDCVFDAERHRLLEGILDLRPKLTQLSLPLLDVSDDDQVMGSIDIDVPAKLIMVIRDSTFFLHGDGLKRETPLVDRYDFHVGNLDPEVALLNLVRRGGAIWSKDVGARPAAGEAYAQLMMHGLYTAFRHLNGALRTGRRHKLMLEIFCGNLRNLFDFLARLIAWLIEDAISEELLKIAPDTKLDEVLAFLASANGREVLRRRSYRLIEILLFYRLPWFEPLVQMGLSPMAAEFLGGRRNPGLTENPYFTGFLDNTFNYHVRQHHVGEDLHPLLEKIRIIQLLRGQSLNPEQLEGLLESRLGYVSNNLTTTMRILVRGQLVRADAMTNDVLFTATTRGEIMVDHVARSMTYLEHVYHQTLFPSDFLPSHTDSPRRGGGVETWTAQSIRNCYVFLAYMRFVENNRAQNKTVPAPMRVYEKTLKQVRQSIVGIIGDSDQPETDLDVLERQIAIAREALTFVERTVHYWERKGYVAQPGHK